MILSGQTVLITGACGRIGSATAKAACHAGANLVLSDISQAKLIALQKSLSSKYSSKINLIKSDISNGEGIDFLIKQAKSEVEKIDAAIHSAYPTSPGWGTHFQDLQVDYLNQDLTMQLGGAIIFSQKILDYFTTQKGGHLIHISSILGVQSPKFHHYDGTNMTAPIEYAAIKAGIIAITGWLAKYHKNQGIRVNCVSPGGILDNQPLEFLERYKRSCTNIGMLNAEHISSALVFLLSAGSSAINGQNIIVDDGWTL